MFPDLSNKKVDTIQKVINEKNDKPKPRINMTNKGPLHKQVIIPMPNKLGKNFTKDSASHVININHALKILNLIFALTLSFQTIKVLSLLPTM